MSQIQSPTHYLQHLQQGGQFNLEDHLSCASDVAGLFDTLFSAISKLDEDPSAATTRAGLTNIGRYLSADWENTFAAQAEEGGCCGMPSKTLAVKSIESLERELQNHLDCASNVVGMFAALFSALGKLGDTRTRDRLINIGCYLAQDWGSSFSQSAKECAQ